LIKLFQKFASREQSSRRPPQWAKLPPAFLFKRSELRLSFFLCAFFSQRKSGQTIIVHFTPQTAAPLSAACLRAICFL